MKLVRLISIAILAALFWFPAPRHSHADPVLMFDGKTGLFNITYKTAPVVTAKFQFWQDNWKWLGLGTEAKQENGGYTLKSTKRQDTLALSGEAAKSDARSLTWRLSFNRALQRRYTLRGGIVFKIDAKEFASRNFTPTPELLPDNRGWQLRLAANQPPLEVRFDPRPARVFFERGRKNEVRAFVFTNGVQDGPKDLTMTVQLPEGGRIGAPLQERLAEPAADHWYRELLPWDGVPIDLSYLNNEEKPAGKRGFVRAQGEELIFEDGTPARFWGTNLTASALFRTKRAALCHPAKRLSKLGFNLVRIHHHDSTWVRPNIFGRKADNTLHLDEGSLDKIDWWIKCFKQEGIYVWLDLHVGREFTRKDGISNFEEISRGKERARAKGFAYVNSDMQDRMMEFNELYLNHINSYTGLAYKDDPAIIAILITNENDLSQHFGNALLPNKKVPAHNRIYMQSAKEFAARWGLPRRETWRSWKHGPSKLFLADLEHRFNKRMISQIRGLGVKAPIATTNSWGRMSLSGLFSLTDGDIIDAHAYGQPNPLEANPRYRANLVSWMAAAQVVNKPLSVSEWNSTPFPAPDRATLPPYVAAIARLQGWDALMQYAYSQVPLHKNGRPSPWHAYNDPSMLALMPAAALLFRAAHVSEARETYTLDFGDALINQAINPKTSAALRTLAERSKVRVRLPNPEALPWLEEPPNDPNAQIVTDPHLSFVAEGAGATVSDTVELRRNWQSGVFTVDTPQSQIALGWIGGKTIKLSDVSIRTKTANAGIAVQSLTDEPISKSDRILISMGAQSVPLKRGRLPYLSEPIVAELQIRAPEGLVLFALDGHGVKTERATNRTDGAYRIRTEPDLGTWWFVLEASENLQ